MNGLGIAAGIATAILWTATAVCFEVASKRLGSWTVNVLRLAMAAALFVGLSLLRTGAPFPLGLALSGWSDLVLSGLVGFVVGDALLFRAFVLIGARLSMLIYASVPAMTAMGGYLLFGEVIGRRALVGMGITATGIAVSVLTSRRHAAPAMRRHRRYGIALAIGGSAGQAAGLLLGKRGSSGLDSFAATEIRVLAGLAGFVFLSWVTRRMGAIVMLLKQAMRSSRSFVNGLADPRVSDVRGVRTGLGVMALGAFLGPFLGVSLGLMSVQLLPTGVASTLMSIVPVLLIPVSAFLFHESVSAGELIGTATAIGGVALLAS